MFKKIKDCFQKFFILIVLFASPSTHIFSVGFVKSTLVKTPNGYMPIESLKIGDSVMCFNFDNSCVERPIIGFSSKKTNSLIKLSVVDSEIIVDHDHKFYLPEYKKWTQASKLAANVKFLKHCNEFVVLNSIENIEEMITVYDLTVQDYHNFCVTTNDILVHNIPVVIPILTWIIGEGAVWFGGLTAATAVGAIGRAALNSLANKIADDMGADSRLDDTLDFGGATARVPGVGSGGSRKSGSGKLNCLQDPEDPRCKYNDAPYHHQNSKGWKSPAPKDGQAALENSVQVVDGNDKRRIGISNGEFVVLDRTQQNPECIYHGHVRGWNDLTLDMREALKNAKLVNNKGKIIR